MFAKRNPHYVETDYYIHKEQYRTDVVREQSPVESYYIQENVSPHSEHKSIAIVDDVYMLFNQQRLDRMTGVALSDWLSRTSQTDSQLASLRSRMTDEQLGSFIKSRFIQSRSELLAWSSYLENQYPDIAPVDPAPVDPAPVDPAPADPAPSE